MTLEEKQGGKTRVAAKRYNGGPDCLARRAVDVAVEWLGLEVVPTCIELAKSDVFLFRPLEIVALLVDYGQKYDIGELPRTMSKYFDDFRDRTGLTMGNKYFTAIITRDFYRGVIGGRVHEPSAYVKRDTMRALTVKQEKICEAVARGKSFGDATIEAGYGASSIKVIARRASKSNRALERIAYLKRVAENEENNESNDNQTIK